MLKLIKTSVLSFVAICCISCTKDVLIKLPGTDQTPKATPTIVILGSSTAQGIGANPIDSAWAYRIQETVNKNGIKANFINLALGGYTTYQVMPTGFCVVNRPVPDTARNITKALSCNPALVMISLPTNDIEAGYSYNEILSNYAELTHLLDSAKVKYIIFSTQPRDFTSVNQRMELDTLNNKIIGVYSNHVNNFLDQLSIATYVINPLYSAGDGIHLNNAGHLIIANATLQHAIFKSVVE
jgi:acyl-CoA thioesterase-1